MRKAARTAAAVLAGALGIAFFFTIIGVFGIGCSIAALSLFISLALTLGSRTAQPSQEPEA